MRLSLGTMGPSGPYIPPPAVTTPAQPWWVTRLTLAKAMFLDKWADGSVVIKPGSRLYVNEYIASANGRWRLTLTDMYGYPQLIIIDTLRQVGDSVITPFANFSGMGGGGSMGPSGGSGGAPWPPGAPPNQDPRPYIADRVEWHAAGWEATLVTPAGKITTRTLFPWPDEIPNGSRGLWLFQNDGHLTLYGHLPSDGTNPGKWLADNRNGVRGMPNFSWGTFALMIAAMVTVAVGGAVLAAAFPAVGGVAGTSSVAAGTVGASVGTTGAAVGATGGVAGSTFAAAGTGVAGSIGAGGIGAGAVGIGAGGAVAAGGISLSTIASTAAAAGTIATAAGKIAQATGVIGGSQPQTMPAGAQQPVEASILGGGSTKSLLILGLGGLAVLGVAAIALTPRRR